MDLKFDHVALPAKNIAETLKFYSKQFPLAEILYQDESWGLIRIGALTMAFVIESQHPPHVAFKVESHKELMELAAKVKQDISVHRDGSESFYMQDPDSNAIEIIFYP